MHMTTSANCHSFTYPRSRRNRGFLVLALPLMVLAVLVPMTKAAAQSPSAETGKAISGQCAACHGSNGKAINTSYPNLDGQNYQYLVDQLTKFKKGERQNAIMRSMAMGLSTEQIQDLAAYYAKIDNANCGQK